MRSLANHHNRRSQVVSVSQDPHNIYCNSGKNDAAVLGMSKMRNQQGIP
jgi:hypothetical protein